MPEESPSEWFERTMNELKGTPNFEAEKHFLEVGEIIAELDQDNTRLTAELAEAKRERALYLRKAEERQQKYRDLVGDIAKIVEPLFDRNVELEREVESEKESRKTFAKLLQKAEKIVENKEREVERRKQINHEYTKRILELDGRIDTLMQVKFDNEQRITALEGALEGSQAGIRVLEKDYTEAQERIDFINKQWTQADKDRQELEEKTEKLEAALGMMKAAGRFAHTYFWHEHPEDYNDTCVCSTCRSYMGSE